MLEKLKTLSAHCPYKIDCTGSFVMFCQQQLQQNKKKPKNKKLEKLNFIIILYFLYYSQESMKSGDIPKRSLRTYENFYYKMQTTKI